jgi:hypothetical protein
MAVTTAKAAASVAQAPSLEACIEIREKYAIPSASISEKERNILVVIRDIKFLYFQITIGTSGRRQ